MLHLYDIDTGKELPAPTGDAIGNALVFAPDGKSVALGNGRNCRLHDTASGKELWTVALVSDENQFSNDGANLAFAPDGKTLATAAGGVVRLWDVATGQEIQPGPVGHTGFVYGSAVGPDGRTLATLGEDLVVRLWDSATGKELRRLEAPKRGEDEPPTLFFFPSTNNLAPGTCLALSPRGQRLAAAWPDGSILVWNTADGKLVHRLRSHEANGTIALAFAPNGKALASGGTDGRVFWWDVASGRVIRQFAGSTPGDDNNAGNGPGPNGNGFSTIALAPDGRTLAAAGVIGLDQTIQIWELSSGEVRQKLIVRPEGAGNASGFGPGPAPVGFNTSLLPAAGAVLLAFAPTGNTLAWSNGTSIRTWDALRGKELRQFAGQDGPILATAFSPSGKYLAAASSNGSIRLWDVHSGTVRTDLTGIRGSINTLTFLGDNRTLASAGTDTAVLLWDVPAALADAGRPLRERTPAELWTELGSADASKAHQVIVAMVDRPGETVTLLRSRLNPEAPANRAWLDKLLLELQDNRFAIRKKATEELEKLGELAEPALRKVLEANPPLEVKMRIEQLLQKLDGPVTHPDRLRALRAIEVLEELGTAEAREVLQTLTKGTAEARLTQEAQAALERLKN
jgi:WD40 repeat protein